MSEIGCNESRITTQLQTIRNKNVIILLVDEETHVSTGSVKVLGCGSNHIHNHIMIVFVA